MRVPKKLRCFAKYAGGVWQAVCIDLNLAAQDRKLNEAKRKLHAQIEDYLRDACTVDRAYAKQLLSRKAPWSLRLEYYRAFLAQTFTNATNGYRRFIEPMPKFACA